MSDEHDQKSALVPRLRFPEFREAGEWEVKPLSAIARITQGGTPSTSVSEYWGGSIQWITPAEMGKEVSPYISKTTRSITDEGLRNCSSELLPPDSVILSTRAPIGHLAINSVPMAINQGCRGIVVKTDSIAKFVYFSLGFCQARLESLGAGNTFKELSGSALKSFTFPIPQKGEQQKIADCLSSLDELIAAQAQKLDALKTHKKGLMQQLFPAEGEPVPRLRFPEFRESGEWNEWRLEDALRISATYGIVKAGEFQKEGIPMLRGGDIKDGRIGDRIPLVSTEIHSQYKRTILERNDVVIALVGYPGEAAVIPPHYVGANISRAVGLLRPKEGILADYLVGYLNSPIGRKTVLKPSAGSAQVVVNLAHLNDLVIPIPEANEQQKIANCLSSIDDLIAAQAQKIELLKRHKKGLMQQLFPVLDEVLA